MHKTSIRACGKCSACCYTHGIKELHKDNFLHCVNEIAGSGCRIYGRHPKSCRAFTCSWLSNTLGSDTERPDIIGLVVELEHIKRRLDDPDVLRTVEVWPGAFTAERGQLFALRQLKRGLVIRLYRQEGFPQSEYHLYRLPRLEEFGIRLHNEGYRLRWYEVDTPGHPIKG